jgi:DMSO/TMAO reductase YedYZ molybdopterin-dependent catalytic subunit
MKRILLMAAVAALIYASVFAHAAAQGDQPAMKPAAAAPAAPVAPAVVRDPEAKPAQKDMTLVLGPGQSSVKEDARHCLEQSTNIEIIKCAEPYLPVRQKKM